MPGLIRTLLGYYVTVENPASPGGETMRVRVYRKKRGHLKPKLVRDYSSCRAHMGRWEHLSGSSWKDRWKKFPRWIEKEINIRVLEYAKAVEERRWLRPAFARCETKNGRSNISLDRLFSISPSQIRIIVRRPQTHHRPSCSNRTASQNLSYPYTSCRNAPSLSYSPYRDALCS